MTYPIIIIGAGAAVKKISEFISGAILSFDICHSERSEESQLSARSK
jgi:hypothetical protein